MKRAIVVLAVMVLAVLLMGCTTSLKSAHTGRAADISITAKDFEVIGLVYHETVVEKGFFTRENGEMLTYIAMLREAERIGGNGIVNIMIDKRSQGTYFFFMPIAVRETWFGSALAIRYTQTPPPEVPMSTGSTRLPGSTGGGGFLQGLFGQ
jgi:hypothetical protein